MKELIIFDLDGTLLNTIADLANSTNYALRKNGFPEHEITAYKFFVGNGINKLFERALPHDAKTDENILKLRKDFLSYYDKHNTDVSEPYLGIRNLLECLNQKKRMLAVASNKYHSATLKLVKFYFPSIPFIAILGQREGIPAKPDPTIIQEIFSLSGGCTPADALYVGDSGVDMQTAKNAGVESVGVTWGFRPIEELEVFKPDHIVDHPEDILKFL